MAADPIRLSLFTGTEEDAGVPVLLQVVPPNPEANAGGRKPSDIVCVIDVSGSMGTEATIQSSGGTTESHGLSLLDIAKHGVKTVVKTLGPADRLSVIWFSHQSEVCLGLTYMTQEGQKQAEEAVDGLQAGGGTNIWNGLDKALETLRNTKKGNLGHIMLLTDGQSSDRESVMPRLQAYKQQYEKLPGTISTFGFGYNIDSELLCRISSEGSATFAFIPDAGFVGTIFVNTMSNLLVTMGTEAYLTISPEEGCELVSVEGNYSYAKTGTDCRVNLGTVQFGQPRDIVAIIKKGSAGLFLTGKLQYQNGDGEQVETDCAESEPGEKEAPKDDAKVGVARLRSAFVTNLSEAVEVAKPRTEGALKEAMMKITDLSERAAAFASGAFVTALKQDIDGQCTEAVSRSDYYWRWGCHYLPSIMFAHKVQQRNNFKDPSVQLYGGAAFEALQEEADDIFNTMPAPTPSRTRPSYGGSAPAAPAAPTNMAAYNDRYGVCIDASSFAQLANGEMCPVGRLRKGDRVAGPDGAVAQVQCLVQTACASGRAWLAALPGGARVTPYHPVHVGDKWCFPVEVADVSEVPCQAVCSFVVEGAPAVLLQGGVAAVALGHGLAEGAAEHPYFGTDAVLNDLANAPGFEAGLVEVQPGQVLRDEETGLVSGFRF
mmetsp:Transcript_99/g.254  ORF Transcript_99/g.254 Transcript_99/m.254 type:complete len:658 (+) Transcript_99:98-2071(+)